MQNHTKGPWYVVRPKEAARNGSPILATGESVGVYFAHGSNGEANARLIAAAPDLLAALLRLVGNHVDLGEIDSSTEERAALDQCRAAIAKANGNP